MKASRLIVLALLLGSSCGQSMMPIGTPDGLVVTWSHDCRSITCSGNGTDTYDPALVKGADCAWTCAEFEGSFQNVRAKFRFGPDGCLKDPAVTKGPCL